MPFVVSESTASKIRDLIGDRGSTGTAIDGGNSQRQSCFIKCESWNGTSGTGTCSVAQVTTAGMWAYFGTPSQSVLLRSSASGDLSVGVRYWAHRFGRTSGGLDIFVAYNMAAPTPELGCGLEYDEDGKIVVDVAALAGDALEAHVGVGSCTIDVVPGCHITLHGGASVNVDVDSLAGNGLEVGSGDCPPLQVKTGCGTIIDGDGAVAFFAPDVALGGLEPVEGCGLRIKQGCGITLDGEGGITVFAPDVVGNGLEPGATPCQLAVKTGCGVTIDGSGGVTVFTPDIAGAGLSPVSGCGLEVNVGCGLKIESDQVKFDNTIVGQGLRRDADGCRFDVNPGCHITLEGGAKIGVDVSGMARNGLEIDTTGDCDGLKVKAACGIFVDADGVAVKNTDLAGDCLIPDPTTCLLHVDLEPDSEFTYSTITAHTLSASGCNVSLQTTTQNVTVKKNACGLVVDVVLGSPVTATQTVTTDPAACLEPTDWGDLCLYCQGYGEYGGGGTPGGPGYCWDSVNKLWVVCVEAPPIE